MTTASSIVENHGVASPTEVSSPLTPEELRKIDAYWRACNYLSAGMIYLRENPLLREPLKPEHIKNRLLGHWGSDPGQSFDLGSPEPSHQEVRLECDVHLRTGPWRAGDSRQQLSRRPLLRDLSGQESRRSGHAEILSAVFVSRWNWLALHAGNSRFHSRRRRAWLLHFARLRSGLR